MLQHPQLSETYILIPYLRTDAAELQSGEVGSAAEWARQVKILKRQLATQFTTENQYRADFREIYRADFREISPGDKMHQQIHDSEHLFRK